MTIDKDMEARILRLHHVEKWGVHTIARQLAVHHTVVERVLGQAGLPAPDRGQRPSKRDAYNGFILQTLEKYPRLSAQRIYVMACERGYQGASSHFRARVAELRPRKSNEAYLRLQTYQAEEMQMDWGCFGHVQIGRARRPLMAFVMVLSWSRMIFLRFYLNQRMENFIRGHVAALQFFGGSAKVCLYDNLKSAVIDRHADAIRFNPNLLELSAHYHFEPRPCAPYRGNQKGRVERSIRFIRDSFFAARSYSDISDLNQQAERWCLGQAAARPCPQDPTISVGEAFAREKPSLLALPDNPFATDERVTVSVGKTPYVRYDLNDYSVPHTHTRRALTVLASIERVRILDGVTVIADHERHFGKGEQIENPAHIQALIDYKRTARHQRAQDRLAHSVPLSAELIRRGAERDYRPSTLSRELLKLLDSYGATELEAAINEALERDVPHPNAVRLALERRREERNRPPPLTVPLPEKARAQNISVRSGSLADYDQINSEHELVAQDNEPDEGSHNTDNTDNTDNDQSTQPLHSEDTP